MEMFGNSRSKHLSELVYLIISIGFLWNMGKISKWSLVGAATSVVLWQQYWKSVERNLVQMGLPPVWPQWRDQIDVTLPGPLIELEGKKAKASEAAGIEPITLAYSLPYRCSSKLMGRLCGVNLPKVLRRPVIGSFAWLYGCNLGEAVHSDLSYYKNLADFFSRDLKISERPISDSCLVSPCDGLVIRCGDVENGMIDQVKGLNYSVKRLMAGDDIFVDKVPKIDSGKKKRTNQKPPLKYFVVYLNPGDYHAFHSPADWTVDIRRHISGDLLSVREKLLKRIPHLFCFNERVVLSGEWKHGRFSLTAVGATNVGNIRIERDPLRTNQCSYKTADGQQIDDRTFALDKNQFKRGEKLGEFRLGSTVVLIFDAPDNFHVATRAGDRVKFGQALGFVETTATNQSK